MATAAADLHQAARGGDAARLEALLADAGQAKAAVNSRDQHRRTPLHLAAFFGHAQAARCLLEHGADVQCQAMDGFLPLHFAAQAGHLEVLRLLARHVGASGDHAAVKRHVNQVVRKGKKSALHLAVQKGHAECARFLVTRGASTHVKTSQGQTALDLCKSEDLRADLRGASAAASAEAGAAGGEDAPPAGAAGPAGGEPPAKRACPGAGAAPAGAPAEVGGGALPAMCPARQSPSAAAPGAGDAGWALARGPFALACVSLSAAEGDRSYPPGVPELAELNWTFAAKEAPGTFDGPVWSISSHEVRPGGVPGGVEPVLHLKLQRSEYKLLLYTHFSDEAEGLAGELRCNACCVAVLAETADGLLVMQTAADSGMWHTWPASCVVTAPDLEGMLRLLLKEGGEAVGDVAVALQSARLLALADAGEEAADGHRHELLFTVRLAGTADDVRRTHVGPGDLKFVRAASSAAPSEGAPDPPDAVSLDDVLSGSLSVSGTAARVLLSYRELAPREAPP